MHTELLDNSVLSNQFLKYPNFSLCEMCRIVSALVGGFLTIRDAIEGTKKPIC